MNTLEMMAMAKANPGRNYANADTGDGCRYEVSSNSPSSWAFWDHGGFNLEASDVLDFGVWHEEES